MHDADGLAQLFAHEQVAVFRKAGEMMAVLRERMVSLREALAA